MKDIVLVLIVFMVVVSFGINAILNQLKEINKKLNP